MISDAKIGLLLGLVLIFIIVFVINGLPWFYGAVHDKEPTTDIVNVGGDFLGIGVRGHKAQETIDRKQLENEPVKEQAASADDSSHPQPSSSNSEVQAGRATEPAVVALQDTKPKKQEPAKPAQVKSYIVQDGENLSVIAKKFYGNQEGNKLANIKLIFEANRDILKSVDSVAAGNKIVIPSLPNSPLNKKQIGDIPSPQFERVESVGNGAAEPGRWYIVKENDSLWKIATKQLGKGSRYTEIIKLNGDKKLTEETKLSLGMRLRLPAK